VKPLSECRLYAFVDTAYLNEREPAAVARALCDGGADLIQLRAKRASADEVRQMARAVQEVCRAFDVWFVVNDHPQIASSLGAPLTHLGQDDFFGSGCEHARDVLPEPTVTRLGLSTHSPTQAERALRAEPAYLAVGPVYATPTKPDRSPVTLDYVRWAAGHIPIPWFAIGGIDLDNLQDVLEAGAKRVCVVSAILNAKDPLSACRAFGRRLSSFPP